MKFLNKYIISLIIFIIGLTVTAYLFKLERDALHSQKMSSINTTAKETLLRAQELLGPALKSIERIAKRWETDKGTSKYTWSSDINQYIADYKYVQALEWVDSKNIVRWIIPLKGNEQALNYDLGTNPTRLMAIETSKKTSSTYISKIVELKQKGKGFLTFSPITFNQKHQGFILAVFKVKTLVDQVFNNENFHYSVFEDDQLVLTSQNSNKLTTKEMSLSKDYEFKVLNLRWDFTLAPTSNYIKKLEEGYTYFTLYTGIFYSVFLAFLTLLIISNYRKSLLILKTKDAMEEALSTKSIFFANMSHEIRTPLNGILGMVHLLGETQLDEQQQDMAKTIKSSGDHLLTIINDILDITKIETGKIELENVNFDLKACLNESILLVDASIPNSNVNIELIIQDETPQYVFGDITRIRQILVNYLSNALKFTKEGTVTIQVESKRKEGNHFEITFHVKDTGIGIKQDNLKKLFKSFGQADSSITREFGGTGLGLAISSKLARRMNGSVGVTSIEGVGSTFSVTLPLKVGDPTKILSTIPKEKSVEKDKQMAAQYHHKILVVDDSQVNQKLMMLFLEKFGYQCDFASNGYEVLDALESMGLKTYTTIFMDMQMPEMDGVTATKKIVERYGDSRPNIIAMTANAFREDELKCIDSGMVDFILKPINVPQLKEVLIKWGTLREG
ncbi:MAG: response regulator [Bacteriovoracaceae bacterium]|nr:response regulator [Bacteriovoracaceae bacterium]